MISVIHIIKFTGSQQCLFIVVLEKRGWVGEEVREEVCIHVYVLHQENM